MSQSCGSCVHWKMMRGVWGECTFPEERMPIWVALLSPDHDHDVMPENAGQTCQTYEVKPT